MTLASTMRALIAALLLGPALLGCSSRQRNEDFIPDEDAARHALESYLRSWQHGNLEVSVPGADPVVMSGDSLHSARRPLKEFAILGPVSGDAQRCYAVRLVLDAPHEVRRDRYVVVGMNPIWVMLHDDFEKLTHWCNEPLTTKKSSNGSGESVR